MKHIVVVGLMGVGKTTTAAAVALQLGVPLRDSDRDIERLTGRSGRDIAAADGVDALHALEEQVLLDALEAEERSVITAAGWTIESASCREALARRAIVVWLTLPIDEILRRIATGAHRRSMSSEELDALVTRRTPLFAAAADLAASALRSTEDIVRSISEFLDADL
jgi:shikimate kinase